MAPVRRPLFRRFTAACLGLVFAVSAVADRSAPQPVLQWMTPLLGQLWRAAGSRQAVALKNILVKQKTLDPAFDNIQETEIPFSKKYNSDTEEAIIVNYLKQSEANILTAPSCCNLEDLL